MLAPNDFFNSLLSPCPSLSLRYLAGNSRNFDRLLSSKAGMSGEDHLGRRFAAKAWVSMSKEPKRLLFVCVENSNRSQIAEAMARMHGGESLQAFSAGSRPSGQVNPRAIQSMQELGYDLSQHRSKSLDDLPDVEFEVAVTMGCGDECSKVKAREYQEWKIPDRCNPAHG